MAIVQSKNPFIYPAFWSIGAGIPGRSSVTMSSTSTRVMGIVTAPKDGDIRKVGWSTRTATTPQSLDIRLETIDGSGLPTGTLWGTNTTATVASPASNTTYWSTLTADATVTRGDRIAVVVQWTSTTGTVGVERNISANTIVEYDASNYVATYTSGSWTKAGNMPAFGLEYSDGSAGFANSFPPFTSGQIALGTGTSPDEAGLYFKLPFKCDLCGVIKHKSLPSGATFAFKVYDSDGSTVLKSSTGIDSDWGQAEGFHAHLFPTSATLEANTWYRSTFLPETATTHTLSYIKMLSNAALNHWPTGRDFYLTQRTDAGSWTETDTQFPLMWLLIDGVESAAGGGGGPLIGGRLIL